EQAAEIALRTQQVLMEETGVVNVADPLGGSWYVEALTDKIEAEAEETFAKIVEMGGGADAKHEIGPMTSGILRAIEDGWFMSEIAESAFRYQVALEKGEKKVVGVNGHHDTVSGDLEILRVSHEVEVDQVAVLRQRRSGRDQAEVDAALAAMVEVARTSDNLIPSMLEAARHEATLGEICAALRSEWGDYREPATF
ncbi:MAG TPA: methylmalonyl-CoA mutase family protein, partial [Nocardioidaceae bacterium]|nr:methylmalonyl-CoA mutase family protein [Nocardioidaceae bacterium]